MAQTALLNVQSFKNDKQNKIATSRRKWQKNFVLEFYGSKPGIIRYGCAFLFRPWCQAGVKLLSSWPGNSPDLNPIKWL